MANENSSPTVVAGILFFRSVRSTFCSLSLAPLVENKQVVPAAASDIGNFGAPILVRIQFFDQVTELRSFCRRSYKLGDWMEIRNGTLEHYVQNDGTTTTTTSADIVVVTEWKEPRLVIDISSPDAAKEYLTVVQNLYWNMFQCQQWQRRFFPPKKQNQSPKILKSTTPDEQQKADFGPTTTLETDNFHGGDVGKRVQGEHVAKFLIASMMHKLVSSSCSLDDNDDGEVSWLNDPLKWSTWDTSKVLRSSALLYKQVIDYLNSGSGVVDIAGGSGHVSMTLGMMGVKSTVVDARESVGKLPRRDRHVWNRAVRESLSGGSSRSRLESYEYCLPVVPFQAVRAWFGNRPTGVDPTFRHPDQDTLPVCDETSDLLARASAFVALHPDEATGDIVRVAVHQKTPFVVVPCCVFARLFPDRMLTKQQPPGTKSSMVSSYDDLLCYLKEQDPRIAQTELPFDGKNTALWSTFD